MSNIGNEHINFKISRKYRLHVPRTQIGMYSGTVRLKGRNPLPMLDPGDGPGIDSIAHDKMPRGSFKPRSMTVVYYKKCLQKVNSFFYTHFNTLFIIH